MRALTFAAAVLAFASPVAGSTEAEKKAVIHLLLYKLADGWKIVSKTFHTHAR
jgi:hypothetical protein